MIFDIRTYIWSSLDQLGRHLADRLLHTLGERPGPLDASPTAHDRAMTCVDASFVLGFRSERLGARIPNELVAEFVGHDPQHRLGVAGVDPMMADAVQQVRAADELGLVGIAVSPSCQGFHPANSAAMRVYDECANRNMPVFIAALDPLTPGAELEFARPALWDEVARTFPSLPLLISQLGHPWIDETLVLLSKHRSIFADISGVASRPWQLYNSLLSAASFGVMDRLLFASGFPYDTPERTIESLYSVNAYSHGNQLPTVPRAQIRGIVERDALACMGIEATVSPRKAEPVAVDDTSLGTVEISHGHGRTSRLGS